MSKEDYVTVRIPRQLANEIDKIIRSRMLGYRTRAELVNEAIRGELKKTKEVTESDR